MKRVLYLKSLDMVKMAVLLLKSVDKEQFKGIPEGPAG
jgi:hypothetical protein